MPQRCGTLAVVELVAAARLERVSRHGQRFASWSQRACELAVVAASVALVGLGERADSRLAILLVGALALSAALGAAAALAALADALERTWVVAAAHGAATTASWLVPLERLWMLVPMSRHAELEQLRRERGQASARLLLEGRGLAEFLALVLQLNAQSLELVPSRLVLAVLGLIAMLGQALAAA